MTYRFHIHTLGCKVNRAESEQIAHALIERGWENARSSADADICIVNTCTVTGEADAKNRKLIRRLLEHSSGPVLVTGCAVNLDADFYRSISTRVRCESNKLLIAQRADELTRTNEHTSSHSAAQKTQIAQQRPHLCPRTTSRPSGLFRTRVDLKVQDGCDNACTYCIVPTARGPARCVPADQVIAQARGLGNVAEVVLVGIDLAAYNDDGLQLSGLVERLLCETKIGRVRISSVEPQNINDSLIELLASWNGRVCRHLHVCLQSGSNYILEKMKRHYTAEKFYSLIATLREHVPGLALSTDIIVGFPGETDTDFAQTCELVRRCAFMRLHVFRYSKRPATPACAMKDQIAPEVKIARSKRLIAIGNELAYADRLHRIGTTEQVVIENSGFGTSESYHRVSCDPDLDKGTTHMLRFSGIDGDTLIAKQNTNTNV